MKKIKLICFTLLILLTSCSQPLSAADVFECDINGSTYSFSFIDDSTAQFIVNGTESEVTTKEIEGGFSIKENLGSYVYNTYRLLEDGNYQGYNKFLGMKHNCFKK